MNLLNIANGSLQTLSTALVASGGYLVFTEGKLIEGIVLIVAGFAGYILYEYSPGSTK